MARKLNILQATITLGMGGLESVIMDICRQIDTALFHLDILCFSPYDPEYEKTLNKLNIKVHRIERYSRFDFSFFRRIIKLIKELNIDIIHAHSGCFFNMALCNAISHRPSLVYTEHGLPLFDDGTPMHAGLKSRLEDKFAAAAASRIFAVSEEIKENMAGRFPASRKKIALIANGIDTDKYCPEKNPDKIRGKRKGLGIQGDIFTIGSVGRLVKIKNYNILIEAVSLLNRNNPVPFQLVLVGDGPERKNLEKLSEEKGIKNRVFFTGVKYDIHEILPCFDVFALPSLTEGTSISLLEAQACGIPAVVSDVGGNPGIIKNGFNGYITEVNNISGLVSGIESIKKNNRAAETMRKNSRLNVINNFSTSSMVKTYEKTYLEISGRK